MIHVAEESPIAFAPALVGPRFLKPNHVGRLHDATTFSDLACIAIDVLQGMREFLQKEHRPLEIGQVCGPVSTGGTGIRELNLARLSKEVLRLKVEGDILIFDQIVFEDHFRRIRELRGPGASQIVLPAFYAPIFATGYITRLYFYYGWHTSQGATWERTIAAEHGIEIVDLEQAVDLPTE